MNNDPKVGLAKKKIILVVDDMPDNIQLLSGLLKGQYKVKVSTGGEKALKIVQKIPSPDLILLDVMMPEMDGYEVCQRLKSNPDTKGIPIVFITANISPEEQHRGIELGAHAYLAKPVDSTKLFETLADILA